MFIISQPCSLELCLYKVKRGNFGITVQKYPHTQQHIIHKAPRLSLFFKGWLNFSLFKVLELLPTKARHECFEILKLYIKLYIV